MKMIFLAIILNFLPIPAVAGSVADLPTSSLKILDSQERDLIEKLAGMTLPQQAQAIRKKVTLELLKSDSKGGPHFFDFLGDPKKSVEDVTNIEGRYGKVECKKQGEELSRIYIADDAPPTSLLHFYVHYIEIGHETRWCALEGRVLAQEEKNEQAILYHRFEFETLKLLWDLKSKLTMNFEDELLLVEGLTQENRILSKLGLRALDEKTVGLINHSLEVLHSQINYLTWLSRTPEDAGSVLQKMEVLNLRSCAEAAKTGSALDKVNGCIAQRCAISRMACKKLEKTDLESTGTVMTPQGTPTDDILTLVIAAWTKPNLGLACSTHKLRDEFIDHLQEPSTCWKRWYENHHKGTKDLALEEIKTRNLQKLFSVPGLNIDKEITFQKAPSPNVFIQKAYCYFVFQKVTGYGTIPVDQFGYATQGAVISYDKLKGYREWLDDKEGKTCSQLVTLFTGEEPARFEHVSPHNKHMLIINPIAALGGGVDKFKSFVGVDINHQRLHLIFAENKKIQKRVKGEWAGLSQEKQADFESRHSNYDFSEEDTVLREYFAFTRQEHPKKLCGIL